VIGWPARFCAACGHRLASVVVEGRRRRRCPACGWVFYGNPVPAAVALVVRGPSVLLARRAKPPYQDTWDLPGGFLEAGETPEAGLRRELHEELGVRGGRARFLTCVTDTYGPGGFPVLTIVYRVDGIAGPVRAADDVAEARWFRHDAIPFREIAFPAMREALRVYLSRRRPLSAGRRSRRARAGSS
jgi:ADP-ribose pyrophosphatase YjhB (NUDIX family)